jgi:DNA processing protein
VKSCDRCLRRGPLLALLAGRIARERGSGRLPAVLSLGDEELVAALCGEDRHEPDALLERFDGERARAQASRAGLEVVCRHDDGFPPPLLEATDAPRLLYLRGDAALLERLAEVPAVALVGSRRASPYALEVARSLGRELAACGTVVVSGMAFGVDSAAHAGALEVGGPTIAVLAGGADVPSPKGRRSLYRRIVASGLVVSELPPRFTPFPWCFPARNRIMAGLSAMTVVVEGGDRSGSLITAAMAADLGREVGAVPGQVTSRLAAGPNALIADGACLVRSAADVLEALYGPGDDRSRSPPHTFPTLDRRLGKLLRDVEGGRDTVDSLATAVRGPAEVLAALSELELAGLVRRAEGGRYVRTPAR